MFGNQEEYVGVDDEHIYTPIPSAQPAINDTAPAYPVDENVDHALVEGGFPLEAKVNDAYPQPSRDKCAIDPENPNFFKGALFPDIITLKKAMRHYPIDKRFEFPDLKTNKTRFIVKCEDSGCPQRIHASMIF